MTNLLNLKITREHDEFGRLVKEIHSDGYCEEISYTPSGEIAVISITYPNGTHESENYCKMG